MIRESGELGRLKESHGHMCADLKESAMRKILAVSFVLLLIVGNASASCGLEILDEYIPAGFVDTPYSHQLSGYGGSGTYTWSIWSGSLPAGLSLSSSGVISGTPTTDGYTLVYIRMTDATNPSCTDTRAYFVEVF
jgi:Putative Ig domain